MKTPAAYANRKWKWDVIRAQEACRACGYLSGHAPDCPSLALLAVSLDDDRRAAEAEAEPVYDDEVMP